MAATRDLVGLAEAKEELQVSSADNDSQIAGIITRATDFLEREADRKFVLRDGNDVVEDHDLANPQGFLQLRLYPVISLTSIFVGIDATDPIDVDNFVVDNDGGQILMKGASVTPPRPGVIFRPNFTDFPEDAWRLSGRFFPGTVGGAKVTYRGGYATTATVDGALKLIALHVIALIYREIERKSQGKTSEVAQGLSIASKWQPDLLTRELNLRLQKFRNRSETARG